MGRSGVRIDSDRTMTFSITMRNDPQTLTTLSQHLSFEIH